MSESDSVKSIWIFNHYALSPDQAGGTRHYDLGLELTKRGYQVTIFAAGFSHRERREMKLAKGEESRVEDVNGVKFVWIKTSPYVGNDRRRFANMISFMQRSKKIARTLPGTDGIQAPDLIIGSSVHLFAVRAAMNTASFFDARFLMEVRDVWPQTLVDLGAIHSLHPVITLMRRLERRLYRRAESIITPLPGAIDYFVSLGIDRGRTLFLPQGLPLSNFQPRFERTKGRRFRVAYVGSFGPADDVGQLLTAAALLDQDHVEMLMVGDGEEKMGLMQRAIDEGLHHVKFLDPIPKREVPAFLGEVDACLAHYFHARARKKFGVGSNKLVAYMAAARPVVFAGDIPGDIVAESGGGISIEPDDPGKIAAAVTKLSLMSSLEWSTMAERAYRFALRNHAIPSLVDRLESLWKNEHSPGATGPSGSSSVHPLSRD